MVDLEQAPLEQFIQGIDIESIEISLYVSEYDEGGPSRELRINYTVNVRSDGHIRIAVSPRQEGGGNYIPQGERGTVVYSGNDYTDAKDEMRNFFYQFYGEKAIADSNNEINGIEDFGSVIRRKASEADTDPQTDDEVEDERRQALQRYLGEIQDRQQFYRGRIGLYEDIIRETEQEINQVNQEIGSVETQMDRINQQFRDYGLTPPIISTDDINQLPDDQQGEARQLLQERGRLSNTLGQLRDDRRSEQQEIQAAEEQISTSESRIVQLTQKEQEIRGMLNNL